MDGARLGEQIKSDPSLAATHMIMLTSVDRKGARGEFAAGFAAYLSKPIRIRELLGCIHRVVTSQTHDSTSSADPSVRSRAHEKTPTQRYAGRILVVEDNAVNQKVAQRFLERLGCEVVIADNGEIAVHTCTDNRFDLILMDLQMPVMDGYSATREIRAMERPGVRTPIVALTANAMLGQQERCLAADMDGLLTKPLSIDRLRETLDRVGLGRDADAAVVATV
jgi:CheY-like chemotaxis protein